MGFTTRIATYRYFWWKDGCGFNTHAPKTNVWGASVLGLVMAGAHNCRIIDDQPILILRSIISGCHVPGSRLRLSPLVSRLYNTVLLSWAYRTVYGGYIDYITDLVNFCKKMSTFTLATRP